MRLLLTLLPLALFSYSLGVSEIFSQERGGINEKIEELIPKDARKFYNELSAEDKNVLQDVLEHKERFGTIDALLENLKSRSGILYEKASTIIRDFNDSLDSLGPEAKKFVDDLISRVRSLGTNIGVAQAKSEFHDAFEKFKQLDANSREELKNAFPIVSGVFQNPIFQSLLTMFLGVDLTIPDAPIVPTTPMGESNPGRSGDHEPTSPTATLYPNVDETETETIEPPAVTVSPLTRH
ncbi:hypothetical protein FO519_005459 [Halicephalobus sp. NKZ332]|nr:hypothetical protein FO519_005459 [Halicephalobus sp. NKZ332]